MITVHVREVAQSQGIKNAHQLALKAEIPPNLAVRVWNDEFERIDKKTLDRLCNALKCQPGNLFKHKPNGHESRVSKSKGATKNVSVK